ncbi:MAG: hypothetical protein OXP09_09920 [Gammaproteobacteria bacterium]|nr:hypothetical protein [Gammaproteobacteria bacterium]MDE0365876.1 hypothetical protein [Gammaproteobacteria bacterium]
MGLCVDGGRRVGGPFPVRFSNTPSPPRRRAAASPRHRRRSWPSRLDGRLRRVELGVPPVFMEPGGVYRLEIDFHATSNLFRAGHRIGLQVSSSNFPRFVRNLNTGGNNYDETEWVVAVMRQVWMVELKARQRDSPPRQDAPESRPGPLEGFLFLRPAGLPCV